MSHEVVEAQSFWDCVLSMQRDDQYQAHLMRTMIELRQKPFQNPVLQTHDVGTARNGRKIYSSDVGGRRSDRRVVWQLYNRTVVVLLYGTHAVQERAKRMRIDFDPAERVVTIYEESPSDRAERPYHQERTQVGKLFMAWTDAELAGFGFSEPVLTVLRSIDNDNELLSLESSMAGPDFERAFNLAAYGHPDGEQAALEAIEAEPEPEVALAPRTDRGRP